MKDGFVLFYVKDNEVCPVAMNEGNLVMLQSVIPVVFGGEAPRVITNKSQGKVKDLMDEGVIK